MDKWVAEVGDSIALVYPEADIFPHDAESEACPCNPTVEFIPHGRKLIVHNSFDGREILEEKARMVQ